MRADLGASSIIEYESLGSASDFERRLESGSALYIRVCAAASEALRSLLSYEARRVDARAIAAVPELRLLAEVLDAARADGRSIDFDDAYGEEVWLAIGAGTPKHPPDAPLPYSIAGTSFELFVRAIASREDRAKILGDDIPVIPPAADFGYEGAEPLNALTFSAMGVDGVHYAIVAVSGAISETSPVIQISPMDGDAHCVLAGSFVEYLAVSCRVSTTQMESILASERAGLDALVPFLMANFDHSRLFDDEARLRSLERYLPLVELPTA